MFDVLLKLPEDEPASQSYVHVEPWEPPKRLGSFVELDTEPPDDDLDPDEPAGPSRDA